MPKPVETSGYSEGATFAPAGEARQTETEVSPTNTSIKPAGQARGSLSTTPRMNTGRAAHTATLLPDGKVLIAGGFREEGTREVAIASAEIYDPAMNRFSPTGEMIEARSGHTATLLPNGLVLIAGGWGVNSILASAELYDSQTGQFQQAASLSAPRAGMTATLLQDGRVLIVGGESEHNMSQLAAEIYDPATDRFTLSGNLNTGRAAHTATLLKDGRVLLTGGSTGENTVLSSAEVYDPASQEFRYAGEMNMVRHKHAAVLLEDGDVLVIGGSNEDDWSGKYNSAEIFSASREVFNLTDDLHRERFKLTEAAVLLRDGNVLIGGGHRQIELFDAPSQRFIAEGSLDNDYYFSVITMLQDGRVLITGGYDASIQPSDKAWIYDCECTI